jgi:hypothetical protein
MSCRPYIITITGVVWIDDNEINEHNIFDYYAGEIEDCIMSSEYRMDAKGTYFKLCDENKAYAFDGEYWTDGEDWCDLEPFNKREERGEFARPKSTVSVERETLENILGGIAQLSHGTLPSWSQRETRKFAMLLMQELRHAMGEK